MTTVKICGVLSTRNHSILRRCAGSYMKSHQVRNGKIEVDNLSIGARGKLILATPQEEKQSHESKEFNKEEIESLRYFLSTLEASSSSSTCSLQQSSKTPISHALNAFDTSFKDSCIIDSGITDHMNSSSQFFLSYSPCSSNRKIATADGFFYHSTWNRRGQNHPFIDPKKCPSCA